MWILQFLKFGFNATFDYFMQKVKGRFAAFAIQLVLSYVAVAVFTFIVTLVTIPLFNQGEMAIDVFSTEGMFQWIGMIDPIWIATSVVCVNYFFTAKPKVSSMTFADFYKSKSSGFWLDLVVSLGLLAIIFVLYNYNLLFYSYTDNTPLEMLLTEGFENSAYSIQAVLSSWLFYLVYSAPVAAVVIIEIRERKRTGVAPQIKIFRPIISAVLVFFISSWIFNNLENVFGELVLNLINVPFKMVEIPVFLSIVSVVFFKTFHLIFFSAFIHFLINNELKGFQLISIGNESNDLLDN